MPTKGKLRRITSTIPYNIIQKGCIKEKYERAKKRKISQAVQRETPLRSRFPFSLLVACLAERSDATCHRQAHATVPNN